jgi:replication factor A1
MPSEEEILARMDELGAEMGGLLSSGTLRRLALASLGVDVSRPAAVNEVPAKKVADLVDRETASVQVIVTSVPQPRVIRRSDGSSSKVLNIGVKDDTGSCRLALWDAEIDLVREIPIEEGCGLLCDRCYVKLSRYGIDIGLGRFGKLSRLQ